MRVKKHKTYFLGERISEHRIALRVSDGFKMIMCGDILYIEANRAYSNFYLTNGTKIIVSKSLSFFQPQLIEWNFIRTHKSYMINLQHVEKYICGNKAMIVLSNESQLPVANRRKSNLVGLFKISRSVREYPKKIAV